MNHWTFTSNSCGYMLYKDGVAQEGAGTFGKTTRRRSWQAVRADSKMFAETARRICGRRNNAERTPT